MTVYLDVCSIQRPLDTKDQARIAVEAEAVLAVVSLIEAGIVELISSEPLLFEASRNPDQTRREYVLEVLGKATQFVRLSEEIERQARTFTEAGLKPLDALHLASAEISKAEFFCTCDDKFLKKAKAMDNLTVRAVSPIELIEKAEL